MGNWVWTPVGQENTKRKFSLVNWLGMSLMVSSGVFAFIVSTLECTYNAKIAYFIFVLLVLNFGYYLSEKK